MEDIDARERQFMEKTPEGMFYLWLANAYERWMHEEDPEVLEEELAEIFGLCVSFNCRVDFRVDWVLPLSCV